MNVLHLLRVTRQKVKVDLLAECQNQKRMDERKSQKEHLTFDPSYFRAATTTYGGLSNSARNALWKPVGHRTPDDVRILTVGQHLIDLIRRSLHKNRRWIISWCLSILGSYISLAIFHQILSFCEREAVTSSLVWPVWKWQNHHTSRRLGFQNVFRHFRLCICAKNGYWSENQ